MWCTEVFIPLVGDMDTHWTCVVCPWHEVCLEAVIYESCLISPCGLMDIYYWTITYCFTLEQSLKYGCRLGYKALQLEQ
jgi:hypothetical protein